MNPNYTYRILMDARWELEDLHTFPHAFEQAYTFVYCLDSDRDVHDSERIARALDEYPWLGGYSYMHIYRVLKYQVPKKDRPLINSIQYASPGWIELFLDPAVAINIAKSVGALCTAGTTVAGAIAAINKIRLKIAKDRKKAGVENMKLTAEQKKHFNDLCDQLARHIGFKNLKELHKKTGSPETSLKLLMAHYRRLQVLVDFVESEKVALPIEQEKKSG